MTTILERIEFLSSIAPGTVWNEYHCREVLQIQQELNDMVILPRQLAVQAGLLTCAHCGWPENNHFNWGKRKSAHDSKCSGFEETLKKGI